MTDRLTIHAIVDDHGAMSYVHAGRHMSWPSVADGIRALRHTADEGSREVEAVLHHDRGPVQHVVLKPEADLDLSTQPLMIQLDPDADATAGSRIPPRPQHAPDSPAVQRVIEAAAQSTPAAAPPQHDPASPLASGSASPGGSGWSRPPSPGYGGTAHAPGRPIEAAAQATAPSSPPAPGPASTHEPSSATMSAPERREPSDRSRRLGKIMLAAAAVAAAIGIVTAGVLIFQDDLGDSAAQQPMSPSPQSEAARELRVVESSALVPGYSDEEQWEVSVPEDATSLAFARGLMVIDGRDMTIYDPLDGSERIHSTIDGPVDFAVEATIGDQPALVWRIGRTAYALPENRARPLEYELGSEARISAAGSAVLVDDGGRLSTLGPEAVIEVAAPPEGMIPMAMDGSTLISGGFEGPLLVTDDEGDEVSSTSLVAPAEGMAVLRWITAGHGIAVAIWGEPGADISSGHQVQLTTHRIADGSVISSTPTTTDVVGEEEWHRGQGLQLAAIGPYVFDMSSGELVIDGSAQKLEFDSPTGPLAPAQASSGPVIVAEDEIHPTTAGLLAVIPEGPAIIRSSPDTVLGLPPA